MGNFQSGLGPNYRRNEEHDYSEIENNDNINNNLNEPDRITYETKAEQRKRELKSIAKQPLNSLCECGSQKKYKNCCLKKLE